MAVITEATRNITKSFRKYLSNIPGKYDSMLLYKTAILGTAPYFWNYYCKSATRLSREIALHVP
jgi:hypothetical protein